MPWIESHTVLIRHKKLVLMAKELRLKPVYLMGHLHLLWHTALEQQEDGDLSSWNDDLIAEYAGFNGDGSQFVFLLRKYRWLDGGLLHDWMDYAGRYLESKYRTANPDRLDAIKRKHSQTKDGLKTDFSQTLDSPPNQPNLTNQPKETSASPPISRWFEEVWNKYPNKDGRKLAERSFRASVKTENDFTDIQKALNNYLKSEKVRSGFIKNGSTWFNNWRDWINNPITKSNDDGIPEEWKTPQPQRR